MYGAAGGRTLPRRFAWRRFPGCRAPVERGGTRVHATTGERPRSTPGARTRRALIALHWASSGATSFARGLNDVPKIAALLIVAAVPGSGEYMETAGGMSLIIVTTAMGMGSLWGGMRVRRLLAHRVASIGPEQRFLANLSTSLLVLAGSHAGLPLSTTHVSTGALFGIRLAGRHGPGTGDALYAVLFARAITLPMAAAVAGAAAMLLGAGR